HADLSAGCAAHVSTVNGAACLELGDRLHRELCPRRLLHELMIDAGGIHAIKAKIVVFLGKTSETDGILRASPGTDGSGDQRHQAGPVSAVDWQGVGLAALNDPAHLGG